MKKVANSIWERIGGAPLRHQQQPQSQTQQQPQPEDNDVAGESDYYQAEGVPNRQPAAGDHRQPQLQYC